MARISGDFGRPSTFIGTLPGLPGLGFRRAFTITTRDLKN